MGDQQAAVHTAQNNDHIWNKYSNDHTQVETQAMGVHGGHVLQLYLTNQN